MTSNSELVRSAIRLTLEGQRVVNEEATLENGESPSESIMYRKRLVERPKRIIMLYLVRRSRNIERWRIGENSVLKIRALSAYWRLRCIWGCSDRLQANNFKTNTRLTHSGHFRRFCSYCSTNRWHAWHARTFCMSCTCGAALPL